MSNNKMLIDASHPEETRVALVRGNRVEEFDFESEHKKQIRGNIYLAKVTRVEPSLQAAFVDYGGNRHGFLAFSEIHPDYYQIPVADREALLAQEEEDARRANEEDDASDAEADPSSDDADNGADEADVVATDAASESEEDEAPKPKRRRRSRRKSAKAAEEEAIDNAAEATSAGQEDADVEPENDDVADATDAADSDPTDEDGDDSEETIAADNENDDVVSEPVEAAKDEAAKDEEKPKRRRTTRRKAAPKEKAEDEPTLEVDADTEATAQPAAASDAEAISDEATGSEAAEEKPKRRRTTRRKPKAAEDKAAAEEPTQAVADATPNAPAEEASADETSPNETVEAAASEEPKPRRRRSRRKKSEPEADQNADAETSAETNAKTNGETPDIVDAATDETTATDDENEEASGGGNRRRRRRSRKKPADASSADANDDAAADTPIESVGADDALEEVPTRRTNRRHYKIQEVIKRRQILLVQVVKEERGNKGAALTTYLSLAGRYSVLMPNTARGGGISRKISNVADRKRMKTIANGLDVPKGMGVILRTAGASQDPQEIERDFEYLMRLWENVRTLTLESTAPCLVYEEGSLIKRSIRDLYHKDTGEVLVSGEDGFKEAKGFMAMLMPGHENRVKEYKDRVALFARMGVEDQLDAMLQPQVTLKSGGYIIIDQTEALVAIDVNSGRSTRQHSVEETATQTNLEAADEVARQLKLRDLAGLIVIDFIDMDDRRHIRAVEKRLKDALKNDRARIQVGRISHFGLMEMSRQRIRASVLESTTQVCPTCGGVGYVKSGSSVALSVLRMIEEQLNRSKRNDLIVKVSTPTALYMLNSKRDNLSDLESRFGVAISIEADDHLGNVPCVIDKGELARRRPAKDGPVQVDTVQVETTDPAEEATPKEPAEPSAGRQDGRTDQDDAHASQDGSEDRGRKRRRRRKRKDSDTEADAASQADEASQQTATEDQPDAAATPVETTGTEDDSSEPKRRNRRPRKAKPVPVSDGSLEEQATVAETAVSEAELEQSK
ncbi:MAG: Rne/Rng family ribonuclease, partial [Pseudomonadota bacterium]